MTRVAWQSLGWAVLVSAASAAGQQSQPAKQYFAHPAVEDRYGVIAPWYHGQNGQFDFRLRISEETLKRYPWAEADQAVMPAPHYIFNGQWSIQPDGAISINPALKDWDNGDIGQRSFGLLFSQVDYYRYSGDPAALGIATMTADYVVDFCQTPADHPWPRFFISCPTKGKAYRPADPHGFIQLDITACVGSGLVGAYQLTGNERYWETAKHWADLFAEHCHPRPDASPWPRYANPEDVPATGVGGVSWGPANRQTGGVALILRFLDDVIRAGYTGQNDALVHARAAGEAYLRDVLLPAWTEHAAFGCYYWDWDNSVYTPAVATFVCHYMMSRPEAFPNWRTDVRNILALGFCRLCVNPEALGNVYSGAWAFPEANNCCLSVLQYPIATAAPAFARYGALTGDEWATEIARRQALLWTYDLHETGVVEDQINGGVFVASVWFNCGHTWPFRALLEQMGWQPEVLGAGRENHLMRTASVVTDVRYGDGRVAYHTFDAAAPCEDVLRLAFVPQSITAEGQALPRVEKLEANGYTVKPLSNGDCLVTIRHDGSRAVVVEGDDPQQTADDAALEYAGDWAVEVSPETAGGKLHVAEAAGASVSFTFEGHQVRLIGRADPQGGRADLYLDGVKQLCGLDCWSPVARDQQVLAIKNGLAPGQHTLKLVATGTKNPRSGGTRVYVDALQWSAAEGTQDVGTGGGPAGDQRLIFGYLKRKDYVDSRGRAWRPGLEFVQRTGALTDVIPAALWTQPRLPDVKGTNDPELFQYGLHGKDFTVYFTVQPKGQYHARILLCAAEVSTPPDRYATMIDLQGRTVATDIRADNWAGGVGRAAELVFNDIEPRNGVIALRFWNRAQGEAMVQAIEVGPGRAEPEVQRKSNEQLIYP